MSTMDIFPADAITKLGYDRVRQALRGHCRTADGASAALALAPSADADWVVTALAETAELKSLLDENERLPLGNLPSVRRLLARAHIEGSHLLAEEFHALGGWLETARGLQRFLEAHAEALPHLAARMTGLPDLSALHTDIYRVIDERGAIRPNASDTLNRIRRQRAETSQRLREQLMRRLEQARQNGWTDADAPVLRADRLVIPLKAGFKGQMQGLVHDVSATGQTVFLEPIEALEANNTLRELASAEQAEILRLLKALTDRLRPDLDDVQAYIGQITALDVVQAKAMLARQMSAVHPDFRPRETSLHLQTARHPLLLLDKGMEAVVPMDLRLDAECRLLLISGPNAGGKSVAMQTVALLQLMLQSGLLLPLGEPSRLPLRTELFVDMGDEQSIENDLSTYTSHLRNLQHILTKAGPGTLVISDELGSGTDPLFGGPIAEAALEQLIETGCLGVVTTHYSNLKDLAARNPHLDNAALAFDGEELAPTFQLSQGLPGSSFALEIAGRVGMPEAFLERAREKIEGAGETSEDLLADLQERLAELERREAKLAAEEENLRKRQATHRQAADRLSAEREAKLAEAEEEARRLVAESNRLIENTIRKIREHQADKDVVKTARADLEAQLPVRVKQPRQPRQKVEPKEAGTTARDLQPGQSVRLEGGESVGKVKAVTGERVTVAVGAMELTLNAELLTPISKQDARQAERKHAPKPGTAPVADAATRLDIRGQRAGEARENVIQTIDAALVSGTAFVEIVHGKGQGILRSMVRELLRNEFPQVKRAEDAPDAQGGKGVTIAWLDGS